MNQPAPASTALHSPLAHMPVAIFATVMGVSGLGLAWRKAGHELAGDFLVAVSAAVFIAVSIAYVMKLMRHPSAVMGEFNHPVRSAFFSAIAIGMLLLATGLWPHLPAVAYGVWVAGAILQLVMTLRILARWIAQKHDIAHANPAWFIPIVGNIIVPVLGVRLGQVEVSWFFFSIGMMFWLPFLSIILYRVIFHDDLPPRLVPTLFILVPPPAVGYLAYTALTGAEDPFALVLVNGALFTTLALLALTPRFLRLPFAMSWWAFTFPLDAMALAALEHGHRAASAVWSGIGLAALVLASAVVAAVAVRTVSTMLKGELFVPE
ncbi:SLAC1 anion channel family protein [Magnetospirillum sp. UT-4]|uniref:SLAC1 anion channel family protein n=1 Tax=Magnetospirillum sp. UT-4 TaxID=2681467 RepID=UPI00137DB65A|nr:SLAC1 anion channel family protein [Magnetospirillum sp. UT-4]CAA7625914.1 Potassium-tellurite ethidium and proflavin transporter [Magnetospirillum sp. UT-4]